MLNDTGIEVEELETTEVGEAAEQSTSTLSDRARGISQDRQAIRDAALSEAGDAAASESVVDTLADKDGEITLEDLKKLPGAEGLSDEEILATWKASQADKTETKSEETFKLPFPVYDNQGNKIEALEKISVRDLFEGKIQLGYQALGKEQRKTLSEAIRNASMGHWNEQKYTTTLSERNEVAQKLSAAEQKLEQFTSQQKLWDSALTALSMGDTKPMLKLAEAYQKELLKSPQEIPGMIPVEQAQRDQDEVVRGSQFIQNTIYPAGYDLAQRYGADVKEVIGAIEYFLRREIPFLTEAKIQSVLQYEVPQLLEQNGYTASDSQKVVTPKSGEVEELKKTVAALQERVAEKKNSSTQTIRDKQKKAPPSGGGSTPGAGDSMPSFKSRAQFKAWVGGDDDWAKA